MSSFSLSTESASPPRYCRIVIVDDHPIVRASLRCLLETAASIKVVAEAEDGEEALAKIAEFVPDVALVDVSMPKLDGIEVARRVARSRHPTRVLTLTAFADERQVRDALAAGAAGFVSKSAAAVDLIAAIQAVASGGHYVPSQFVDAVIETTTSRAPRIEPELSIREGDVLRLIAWGFSNQEISRQLSLSVKTVETYKARAMEKIDASSRVDIVRYAVAKRWIGAPGATAVPTDDVDQIPNSTRTSFA